LYAAVEYAVIIIEPEPRRQTGALPLRRAGASSALTGLNDIAQGSRVENWWAVDSADVGAVCRSPIRRAGDGPTLEGLFVEERRLENCSRGFGEKPVLTHMFGALIRAAERLRRLIEFEPQQLATLTYPPSGRRSNSEQRDSRKQ
jgi:hypothetical protein